MTNAEKQQKKPQAQSKKRRGSTVVKRDPAAQSRKGPTVVKKQPPRHAKKEPENWDDLFFEEAPKKRKKPAPHSRSARRARAKRKARVRRTLYGSLAALFGGLCLCIVLFCTLSTVRYFEFLEMRSLLDRNTFYPGVTVDGVDLSGSTLSDAMDAFRQREMDYGGDRDITFRIDGQEHVLSSLELGFGSNYQAILQAAWDVGREGTLEQRYAQALEGGSFTVDRGYDEGILRQSMSSLAASLSTESVDAQITDFIYNQGRFEFSREQQGVYVDGEELYRQVQTALQNGLQTVDVNHTILEPKVTAEELAGQYGELSLAVTNASSSNNNRINNIRLACEAINCLKLEPGEEFSFNEVVGQRTRDAGYKKAGVYISGEVGEEIGGGICQVSTTLFNAVVKADLEITERHNHSLPVSYVDNGKDATVSWGSQDLKFVNSSDEPVYIVAYVTDDWRVRVHVFGKLRTDGLTISLVPVLQQTVQPGEAEYRYTTDIPTGTTRVKSDARKGYRVNTYKAYTDAEGNVVDKQFLCSSYYPARGAIIEVGQ
ncbi:MAG: VanW family protein [Eubacteriales bacterium]|nr:VanW family protein [Eubacteriales bacterium]